MAMHKAGTISTHWPLDQLETLVRRAHPELKFELLPTPGNPGERWYAIMVEAATHAEALLAAEVVRSALKDIPTGGDRNSVYAPQN